MEAGAQPRGDQRSAQSAQKPRARAQTLSLTKVLGRRLLRGGHQAPSVLPAPAQQPAGLSYEQALDHQGFRTFSNSGTYSVSRQPSVHCFGGYDRCFGSRWSAGKKNKRGFYWLLRTSDSCRETTCLPRAKPGWPVPPPDACAQTILLWKQSQRSLAQSASSPEGY